MDRVAVLSEVQYSATCVEILFDFGINTEALPETRQLQFLKHERQEVGERPGNFKGNRRRGEPREEYINGLTKLHCNQSQPQTRKEEGWTQGAATQFY